MELILIVPEDLEALENYGPDVHVCSGHNLVLRVSKPGRKDFIERCETELIKRVDYSEPIINNQAIL